MAQAHLKLGHGFLIPGEGIRRKVGEPEAKLGIGQGPGGAGLGPLCLGLLAQGPKDQSIVHGSALGGEASKGSVGLGQWNKGDGKGRGNSKTSEHRILSRQTSAKALVPRGSIR